MVNHSINYLLRVHRFFSTNSKDVFSINHLTLPLSRTSFTFKSLLVQEFLPMLHKYLTLNWIELISKVKHMCIQYWYLSGNMIYFAFFLNTTIKEIEKQFRAASLLYFRFRWLKNSTIYKIVSISWGSKWRNS